MAFSCTLFVAYWQESGCVTVLLIYLVVVVVVPFTIAHPKLPLLEMRENKNQPLFILYFFESSSTINASVAVLGMSGIPKTP